MDPFGTEFSSGRSVMAVRKKHIRSLVDRLLEQHGVRSPSVPVEKIVEALGLEVRRCRRRRICLGSFIVTVKRKPQPSVSIQRTMPTANDSRSVTNLAIIFSTNRMESMLIEDLKSR